MPLAIFNIICSGCSLHRSRQVIAMRDIAIGLYADMIKSRIIAVEISPGIQWNTDRRADPFKAHPLSCCSYTGADRLQHKNNSIGAIGIETSQVYIKHEIKRVIQVYLSSVPYTSTSGIDSGSKCVTITSILGCRSV